ncbi:sphingosine-1-phosphate phosphatase 2-like [Mercenaria mercenaria]|uniref:sphingosine-1-phosphate phosphatase 2-like n=1 Tax=Mercenaria mercenaria TaxID=6596 RepID=UPI00234E9D48|nr:sphingosine-1-phosphate phosphatase 2-like [Mercenaria mercenaria]
MDLIKILNDPRIVAKFQQVCGVERLPEPDDFEEEFENQDKNQLNNGTYDKYVKQRHSHEYVLQHSYKNNNNRTKKADLQKEGVPPFTSDDSDSDSQYRGSNPYKITPHRINNKFIFYAFKFASFFGDEAFYLTFLPFVLWNVDSSLMRTTVLVWGISMYIGQVGKDIFQWPRPTTQLVIRMDLDFAQEFSMPSTHAVAASSIPFMMAYNFIYRYQVSTPLFVCLAVVWCLMTCGSRMYLGVHSLLDVIVGCLISVVVFGTVVPFKDEIDWFIQTNPASPVLMFLLCVAFSTVLYPAPEIGNQTRPDCVKVIAALTGCLMGQWGNYFNGMSQAIPPDGLFEVYLPSLKTIACAILRFMIGVLTVALVKTVVQTFSVKFLSYMFGLEKADRHHPKIQIPYRFVTYMAVGIIISWTVPILHNKFGLGRPHYYMEVL